MSASFASFNVSVFSAQLSAYVTPEHTAILVTYKISYFSTLEQANFSAFTTTIFSTHYSSFVAANTKPYH